MVETENYVYFWGGILSNFYPCNITYKINDKSLNFLSSEQLFMYLKAMKFNDIEIADLILKSTTPKEAKQLGRKVRNFDEVIWNESKLHIMFTAISHKFSDYNPQLKSYLLSDRFNNKEFVEASPFDRIWGVGLSETDPKILDKSNWLGSNYLGKLLTILRNALIRNPEKGVEEAQTLLNGLA